MVFDARRITGVASGATLTTWENIANPSLNATASSTLEPTFAATGMSGLPSVRFPGGKYMDLTPTTAVPCCFVSVYRKTSGTIYMPVGNSASLVGPCPVIDWSDSRFYVANSSMYKSALGGNRVSPTVVTSMLEAANVTTLRINGSVIALGAPVSSVTTQTTIDRLGARATRDTTNGDISTIVFIPKALGLSLLKRLEQLSAFSFKIKVS